MSGSLFWSYVAIQQQFQLGGGGAGGGGGGGAGGTSRLLPNEQEPRD